MYFPDTQSQIFHKMDHLVVFRIRNMGMVLGKPVYHPHNMDLDSKNNNHLYTLVSKSKLAQITSFRYWDSSKNKELVQSEV